jgi:hypothetical protein
MNRHERRRVAVRLRQDSANAVDHSSGTQTESNISCVQIFRILKQQSDGAWTYTIERSMDDRMTDLFLHCIDTWPSVLAANVVPCLVCDSDLPRDDLPGAFVVAIDLDNPTSGIAMGACDRCALMPDDRIFVTFERLSQWTPTTKN